MRHISLLRCDYVEYTFTAIFGNYRQTNINTLIYNVIDFLTDTLNSSRFNLLRTQQVIKSDGNDEMIIKFIPCFANFYL